MKVKLLGFAPDADPTMPGVLTDCTAIVPTQRGIAAAPSAQSAGVGALSLTCVGAAALRKLDGSNLFFAGTNEKLFKAGTGSYTDVTRPTGVYTGGADDRWRFTQFGNISLATIKTDTLQHSTGVTFSDVSGAPKAALIATVNQFVLLADINDGSDKPNGWICSGIGDYTDWTPSIATQCTTGLLTSGQGGIKAWRRLGGNIIAYKERSIYVGQYAGPPVVWDFGLEIPGDVGTFCQEVVVDIGTAHIFMGWDDFYYFDGSLPVPIGGDIKEWFFARLNRTYAYKSCALHDQKKGRIFFFYPSSGSAVDSGVVYDYRLQRWGRLDITVEMVAEYVAASITYDGLGSFFSTYDDLPDIPYDSPFWVSGSPVPALFDSTHTLKTLDGANDTWSFTTGDFGDEQQVSFVSRVIPRFVTAPASASLTNYYRMSLGDSLSAGSAVSLASGRFDLYRSARWHRAVIGGAGDMELMALDVAAQPDGEE